MKGVVLFIIIPEAGPTPVRSEGPIASDAAVILRERCLDCGEPCRLFFCEPCEQHRIENYMEESL